MAEPVRRALRPLVAAALLGAALAILVFAGAPAKKDYISYWSAARLFTHGGDPYDHAEVFATEKAQGFRASRPLMMRNPPWAMAVVAPLGWLSPRLGLAVWTGMLAVGIPVFLHLFKVSREDRVLAYCFAPCLASLTSGQSSPLLLFGISLFLALPGTGWAGAGLALLALKPHLFLAMWPVLLLDSLLHRNWRVLCAFSALMAAASVLVTSVDHHVWSQYLAMMRTEHLEREFLQTPACLLRFAIAPAHTFVEMLPACCAAAWGLWYYGHHRSDWNWHRHGTLLLFAALVTSPYAWMTDEIVLLPAVMASIAHAGQRRLTMPLFALISGGATALLVAGFQLSSGAYVWTSVAWFGWYHYSNAESSKPATEMLGRDTGDCRESEVHIENVCASEDGTVALTDGSVKGC